MPGRITTVLLDLDGTLTDSRPGIVASYHAALRDLGHAPDPSIDLTFAIGPPMGDVMGRVLALYGDDRIAAGIEAYRSHYGATGLFDNAVYDGIPEALDALLAAGLSLYVATSKRRDFAQRIVGHFGLAARLKGVYGAVPGAGIDHKPELIAHLLAAQGIAPAEALMVGDREYDIRGAHANGLPAIGVLWGYGTREELAAAGAERMISAPGELAEAVGAMAGAQA
jgi:phosphoglycolate phosphatase